ncbi:TPA: hypothetical protein U0K44_000163 [Streptococcus suis]|nr:hypothetical protein [Streptococcus suis]
MAIKRFFTETNEERRERKVREQIEDLWHAGKGYKARTLEQNERLYQLTKESIERKNKV